MPPAAKLIEASKFWATTGLSSAAPRVTNRIRGPFNLGLREEWNTLWRLSKPGPINSAKRSGPPAERALRNSYKFPSSALSCAR